MDISLNVHPPTHPLPTPSTRQILVLQQQHRCHCTTFSLVNNLLAPHSCFRSYTQISFLTYSRWVVKNSAKQLITYSHCFLPFLATSLCDIQMLLSLALQTLSSYRPNRTITHSHDSLRSTLPVLFLTSIPHPFPSPSPSPGVFPLLLTPWCSLLASLLCSRWAISRPYSVVVLSLLHCSLC